MDWGAELAAVIKHLAEQQTHGFRVTVYGHVASYDPKTGRVRVVIPSHTDGDSPDAGFVLSSWMPLGSGFAGNGYGIQVAPKGGATTQNPTGGELCSVTYTERHYGVMAQAVMVYNQKNKVPNQKLEPGEMHIQGAGGWQQTSIANGSLHETSTNTFRRQISDSAKTEHRVQKNGYHVVVTDDVAKIRYFINNQWFALNPTALIASQPPPDPG